MRLAGLGVLEFGGGELTQDVLADGDPGRAVAWPPDLLGQFAAALGQGVEQSEQAGQVVAGDQAVPAVKAVEEGDLARFPDEGVLIVVGASSPAGVEIPVRDLAGRVRGKPARFQGCGASRSGHDAGASAGGPRRSLMGLARSLLSVEEGLAEDFCSPGGDDRVAVR